MGVKGAITCKKTIFLKILGRESRTNWKIKDVIKVIRAITTNTRIFEPW